MTELIIRYAEPSAVMDRAVIPSEVVGTLVRCKDCRHWNSETKGCKRNPSVEAWHESDFCKYGERREE